MFFDFVGWKLVSKQLSAPLELLSFVVVGQGALAFAFKFSLSQAMFLLGCIFSSRFILALLGIAAIFDEQIGSNNGLKLNGSCIFLKQRGHVLSFDLHEHVPHPMEEVTEELRLL